MGLIPGLGTSPWRRKWHPHAIILAWEIPWREDSGGLQSMRSQRVRHHLATKQQGQWELKRNGPAGHSLREEHEAVKGSRLFRLGESLGLSVGWQRGCLAVLWTP